MPGNHDRYTGGSVRLRHFEEWFGGFAPDGPTPGSARSTPTRRSSGSMPPARTSRQRAGSPPRNLTPRGCSWPIRRARPRRLIVACHYPVAAPAAYEHDLHSKRMKNAQEVREWLATLGPHLFCCGHVHAAWAFTPKSAPRAALPELRGPLAPRPDRPPPSRLPGDYPPRPRRLRGAPRLGRRRLGDPGAPPGPDLLPGLRPVGRRGRLPSVRAGVLRPVRLGDPRNHGHGQNEAGSRPQNGVRPPFSPALPVDLVQWPRVQSGLKCVFKNTLASTWNSGSDVSRGLTA